MLLATLTVSSLTGCAHLGCHRGCDNNFTQCCEKDPLPKENLRVIEFELRQLIQLSDFTSPIEGAPIATDPSTNPLQPPQTPLAMRDLTIAELNYLAAKAAPVANRLEAYRDWLNSLCRTSPGILEALAQQARHERSKHVLSAQEAYFNLLKVYTKTPILNRTQEVLIESEQALEKLRQAGVDVPGDPQELRRRRVNAAEGYVEIRYNQQRLNDGLEALLNLSPAPEQPIWTNFQSAGKDPLPTEAEALEAALSRRGDLVALVLLANNSQDVSNDVLASGDTSSGLLGGGFEMPGPPRLWQCFLKKEIEELKKSAQCERKRQLEMMVENKLDQIRLEVRQSLHALEQHQGNLRLKLEQLDTLRRSMEAADKAKDYRPVDFSTRLQQRSDELNLISEIIDEMIAIEIERARLKHSMGD